MRTPVRRRKFLKVAAAVAASGPAISCGNRKNPYRFFTLEEAKTLAVLCDQIIPPDQDPGAAWAGVVNFIDRQLLAHYRELQPVYRKGLAAAERTAKQLHGKTCAELPPAAQTELLALLESGGAPADLWVDVSPKEFFEAVLNHTMQGYYGDPRHGGNRDAVGWKVAGMPATLVRGRQLYEFPRRS